MRIENQKTKDLTSWKQRLIGIEFENPVVDNNGNPVSLSAMQSVWKNLADAGWRAKFDTVVNLYTGVEKQVDEGVVNIISDNGAGNFEIALPPCENIPQAERLLKEVHKDVIEALRKENLSYLGIGIQPGTPGKPIEDYAVKNTLFSGFNRNMEHAGGPNAIRFGNRLFFGLAAHQAGVSLRVPEIIPAVNELVKTVGLITALCGNSSIQNWEILPWKEWRIPAYPFRFIATGKEGFEKTTLPRKSEFTSLADFFKYYWDVPSMVLPPLRNGSFAIPEVPITYPDYFARKEVVAKDLQGKPLMLTPSISDVNFAMLNLWVWGKPHISIDPDKTTIEEFVENFYNDSLESYLEGKVTNLYVEARSAPASPKGEEMAIPALHMGTVNNLSEVQEFTKRFTWEEWWELPYCTAVSGLQTKFQGVSVSGLVMEFLDIVEKGLKKRGQGEEKYLIPLWERAKAGKNPADQVNKLYKKGKEIFLKEIKY